MFIAIDGEAIDNKYSLVQSSTGSELYEPDGIATLSFFEWIIDLKERYEKNNPVFVGFGFKYDIENIVKDLPDKAKDYLFNCIEVYWQGYSIKTVPKKFITIKREEYYDSDCIKNPSISVTIYDVFSFFNESFIKTCNRVLGSCPSEIESGKAGRGGFTTDDLQSIRSYNLLECQLLVAIMDRLKDWLVKCDLKITRWYGPSCIANNLLEKWQVRKEFFDYTEENSPIELVEAFRCGYFGGRMEALQLGTFENTVNGDINSAYPLAITKLPTLTRNGWDSTARFLPKQTTAIYKIKWNFPKNTIVGPFPFRHLDGSITFPRRGIGWYWYPEINYWMTREKGKYSKYIKILKGWHHSNYIGKEILPHQDTILSTKVPELYTKRRDYKAANNQAEYVLKIAQNSLYGKFAQKVGKPKFRNLVWAGLITSHTRATLLKAIEGYEDQIIALSTDGIVSKCSLPYVEINSSKELGEWSIERHDKSQVIMSGVYRHFDNEKIVERIRGHAKIRWDDVLGMLTKYGEAKIPFRYFVGWKLYRTRDKKLKNKYLCWVDDIKTIKPSEIIKRKYNIKKGFNWMLESCTSKILDGDFLEESAPIRQSTSGLDSDLFWIDDEEIE